MTSWGQLGRWLVLAGFVGLGSVATLPARELYVNNETGDDRFEGRSPQYFSGDGPCRSIARALFLAQAGDTVVLAKTAQPYRESVTLQGERHSGNSFRPFRLVGNGATLDGREPIRSAAWESVGGDIVRFEPARKSLGLLYLDRSVCSRAKGACLTGGFTFGGLRRESCPSMPCPRPLYPWGSRFTMCAMCGSRI
jgi:hypothetical protein